ncbi:hypothetical protein ALC56_06218 [Trachymyrmex septentrionalis]|uniref:Uncharacterized protein n=1 Tax=Trachymyrmex septentrionalis TaxID=34720 RepID=A0A151JXB7_9HYME|nr:hypothetical protein ALC56_06218 [Trachymyrmex septentrionalis]
MPLAERLSIWYMHDEAPTHFVRNVKEHLNVVKWGYLKSTVYSSINDTEELRDRIQRVCQII